MARRLIAMTTDLGGPRSAGAHPGPACYGAGGPLTITDVNLLLGRINPDHFGVPVDRAAAEKALTAALPAEIAGRSTSTDRLQMLQGFLDIANEHMAAAIRRISVRHGYDPADYTLVAFGGARQQRVQVRNLCDVIAVRRDDDVAACGVRHLIDGGHEGACFYTSIVGGSSGFDGRHDQAVVWHSKDVARSLRVARYRINLYAYPWAVLDVEREGVGAHQSARPHHR